MLINEDTIRQKYILNILLKNSVILACISSGIVILNYFRLGESYGGIDPLIPFLVLLFFAVLYFISRKIGHHVLLAYFFILAYYLPTTYALSRWGVDLPLGLLSCVLIIVLAGILVDSKFAFETTIFISLTLLILTIFQITGIIDLDIAWKEKSLTLPNVLTLVVMFYIIAIVSWLSNREIERSLKRAIKSEAELKEERDMLEIRVQERTSELEKAQAEKINQAARFIEFGKISSGLFHDLINHMTSLFFDIEKASDASEKEQVQIKEYMRQANETKDVLVEYIEAAKRQLQNQKTDSPFSMKKEILRIVRILGYKLKMEKVEISLMGEFDIITYGNSIKFNQVITNIVLNALDAYENSEQSKRQININLDKHQNKAIVLIEDWAGGISEDIQDKIFEPFFTTKGLQEGTGIGLTTVKNIIEEDFGGTIRVESVWGQGSKFIIEIPIKNEPSET